MDAVFQISLYPPLFKSPQLRISSITFRLVQKVLPKHSITRGQISNLHTELNATRNELLATQGTLQSTVPTLLLQLNLESLIHTKEKAQIESG